MVESLIQIGVYAIAFLAVFMVCCLGVCWAAHIAVKGLENVEQDREDENH